MRNKGEIMKLGGFFGIKLRIPFLRRAEETKERGGVTVAEARKFQRDWDEMEKVATEKCAYQAWLERNKK